MAELSFLKISYQTPALDRLCTNSKYIRPHSCLLSPKPVNYEWSTQNSDRQLSSGKRSIFTLHVSDTGYKKKADFSEKSDSLVTHIQTQTTNSLLAAAQILVQFFFTLAGPPALSLLHVSFRANLMICTVYAQDPGLTPRLSPIQDTPPPTFQLLSLSLTLFFGSSEKKD